MSADNRNYSPPAVVFVWMQSGVRAIHTHTHTVGQEMYIVTGSLKISSAVKGVHACN